MGFIDHGTLPEDFQAALLEYVGTTTFLVLFLGGIQAVAAESAMSPPSGDIMLVMYISASAGLSLLVSAWLFFRVTGAVFNPNISLALVLCKIITPVRFVLYVIAQFLGGITAAALVLALTPGDIKSNTRLGPGINPAQAVFIEMFITAALVLSVLMLAAEKHNATPFAPIGIGLTLFAGHLFAVHYTGAATNTARAFGPAVITGFVNLSFHWVYWVGPFLGSLFATAIYLTLKKFQYWRLTPGQDSVNVKDSPAPVAPHTRNRSSTTSGRGNTTDNNGPVNGQVVATGDCPVCAAV